VHSSNLVRWVNVPSVESFFQTNPPRHAAARRTGLCTGNRILSPQAASAGHADSITIILYPFRRVQVEQRIEAL